MELDTFSKKCASDFFEKGNEFFEKQDFHTAEKLYNMSLAIFPYNVEVWVNVVEAMNLGEREVSDIDEYIMVMEHMRNTGQVNLDKLVTDTLTEEELESLAPEDPVPMPKNLKDAVICWQTQDFIDDPDIMGIFANNVIDGLFVK